MHFNDDVGPDSLRRESEYPIRVDTQENMIVEETPRKLIEQEESPEIQPKQ